jgi:hypothetical protein
MLTHKDSGVYGLLNTVNKKWYIGSALSIPSRKRQHFHFLRKGKHQNRHLQRAFDKYGETAFSFFILEKVDALFWLRAREQAWLSRLKVTDRTRGYNISGDAWGAISEFNAAHINPGKCYLLMDPEGNAVHITNLKRFCTERELHYPKMVEAAAGKIIYRGWYTAALSSKELRDLKRPNELAMIKRAKILRKYAPSPEEQRVRMRTLWKSPEHRNRVSAAIRRVRSSQRLETSIRSKAMWAQPGFRKRMGEIMHLAKAR